MMLIYGTRLYGKIDACGQTYLATRFFHIWYLPLFPIGTQLVLGEAVGGSYRFLPQRLSGRSVLAALLRTWGLLAALLVACLSVASMGNAMAAHEIGGVIVPVISVFTTAAILGAAFFQLGRLSEAEKAQRAIYGEFVGHPIDVARFSDGKDSVRRVVGETLGQRAQVLGLLGYRNEAAGTADHVALALDPTVRDTEYLHAALTLARLEWSEKSGVERTKRGDAHDALWNKIREQEAARAKAAA